MTRIQRKTAEGVLSIWWNDINETMRKLNLGIVLRGLAFLKAYVPDGETQGFVPLAETEHVARRDCRELLFKVHEFSGFVRGLIAAGGSVYRSKDKPYGFIVE